MVQARTASAPAVAPPARPDGTLPCIPAARFAAAGESVARFLAHAPIFTPTDTARLRPQNVAGIAKSLPRDALFAPSRNNCARRRPRRGCSTCASAGMSSAARIATCRNAPSRWLRTHHDCARQGGDDRQGAMASEARA
ncbi:hypothetical protein Rmf_29670 [Roseomonas fluvialis]|uniref:Uncharacterized protein n=1 Tax=Roseomonas fluvialis TaxID=1750527 RepID=A0ABN6P5I6_9PROT|nr:hypothetical protein Rmf_29670 [Roseomonas fluvialis]